MLKKCGERWKIKDTEGPGKFIVEGVEISWEIPLGA